MFASKNGVLDSALDGVGMGIGFTFALACMGAIRELLGSGTLLGFPVLSNFIPGMSIFNLAPGGFFVFALLMALVHHLTRDKKKIKGNVGEADLFKEAQELKLNKEEKEA